MTFSWPFGRRGDPGWRDAAGDPIPARLQALGASGDEVGDRVARRRGQVLGARRHPEAVDQLGHELRRSPGVIGEIHLTSYLFPGSVIVIGSIAPYRAGS